VGVPKQELLLVRNLRFNARKLIKPGPGYVNYVIFEPEVGAGRPDALVLSVSPNALKRFRATGLRIQTPSAAKALSDATPESLGLSPSYVKSLRRELAGAGWTSNEYLRAIHIIQDSMGIEAKVHDWPQAVRQAAKFYVTSHRAALLMPTEATRRIPATVINKYGFGVIATSGDFAQWIAPAVSKEPSPSARLWLLELLLRAIDSGVAYKPSELRKAEKAVSSASSLDK
jgi:hypothetical protein